MSVPVNVQVWDLHLDGTWKPFAGHYFPLEQAAQALAASGKEGRGGKVLLRG
jgi:NADPH:quinone reductase-like Zn-dependent oxidoreductase